MAREFEIRREIELPATAEQVWQAVATGDGTAAWMFPVAEGAPSRVGEVWAGHTVKAFDPPRHLRVAAEGPDGQVGPERRRAGAVHHPAAAQQQVEPVLTGKAHPAKTARPAGSCPCPRPARTGGG